MKKKYLNQKGMTIIELIVAMTIFVIVITLAVGGFISLIRLQSQTETMTDVQQNGRIAIEQITRLARQADEVNIIDSGDLDKITFTNGTLYNCFTVKDGALKKYTTDGCTGETSFTLSSSDVKITKFNLVKNTGVPASLEINLTVTSANPIAGGDPDEINLNTTVLLTGLK